MPGINLIPGVPTQAAEVETSLLDLAVTSPVGQLLARLTSPRFPARLNPPGLSTSSPVCALSGDNRLPTHLLSRALVETAAQSFSPQTWQLQLNDPIWNHS